jgi:translation initiation factor IF-2
VSKRGKHWEEEEVDETPDFAEKASKVGVKGKRRLQPLDDIEDIEDIEDIIEDVEELDLDAVLDNGYRDNGRDTEAVQVSLSIARPPKPKSRPTQAKPPTTPAAAKSKKGAEDRSRTQGRRERRDQEAAIERPEKLVLTGGLTVQELATAMAIPESTIIKTLFFKGIAANINQALDVETAKMVAEEMEMPVEIAQEESEARKVTEMLDASDLENLQRRPPVVTIMGHVDHGKTTLLDSIRKTKVAAGEAGGITQHIGAYHVDVPQNGQVQQVVFLDTPGHEAFTAMRARGARVTDVAILVVAADDGVQPQTVEAISHAKAAGVPIVVAINKVDKIEAQPDRVKQELTEYGLVSEEWGGDTIMVPVSAITGENLDTLLEMILLVSEVEDLYANPDRPAKGTVIEAHLDKARGAVATLLVQNGTLRVGDILVAGSAIGKVRAMIDDRGQRVDVASPSFAVEVLGLGDVPAAGDEFEVYAEEKEARAIATSRLDQQRQSRLQQALSSRRVTLNTLSARAQEGELKELNLILKADVQGSLEAILNALKQLPQNEVQVRVLFAAPGEITETDVDLAAASDAVIVGFNTTFASGARQAADHTGVDVREYNIIYKLLDDIQAAMEGLLEPELVEEILGQAEVRAVFPVGRGMVAGSYIQSGKVIRNCKVRVLRKGQVIHEGTLDSLKRIKEDAREVNAGYECGMGVDNFNTWEIGDVIEAFRMVAKRRTLTPA